MDLSLAKLLNELHVAESIIKQQDPVVALNVEKTLVSKSKGNSRATNHICTTLQGFQETRWLSENEVCIFQANGEPAPALALGDIRVSFSSDRVLVLKDVLYVPIGRNLISVSKIMDVGYNVYFANNSTVIKFNKRFIYTFSRVHDLFIFDISPHVLQQPK
ncbi:uncharacterized protein LOC142174450 [Nicotiana tabacum]|uniref:Uncharacterized protein LOC142174450 n=1 Tax=Nicotiana tabacum TaxID=4097 RepID=A0AC58TGJ0_TOBAC